MSKADTKVIFGIFIGAIIAIVLLGSIANAVFDQTNTRTSTNVSITTPSAENTTVEIEGRNLIGTIELRNGTADVSQYFIKDERLGTDGLLTVAVTSNATSDEGNPLGQSVNASYTFNPDGHAVGSADRSVILLITLFGALAVLMFVVVMLWNKEGSLSQLLRIK